jgi:hypothetical protein
MSEMKVGDRVVPVSPFQLASGSGRYNCAIVVSVEPFVMVSTTGDMLWSRVDPTQVKVSGKADYWENYAALGRWACEQNLFTKARLFPTAVDSLNARVDRLEQERESLRTRGEEIEAALLRIVNPCGRVCPSDLRCVHDH